MAGRTRKGGGTIDSKAFELAEAKLATSGLTLEDAKQLGIEILSPTQTQTHHQAFEALASLKLNYYSPTGEPLVTWPKHPPFYRLRYLEEKNDFSKLTDAKKLRYVQEPYSGVGAYFPRIDSIDWLEISTNVEEPLIITEGELKAAKACKEGFPTIGLGGVYNFRSAKNGVPFLKELEMIQWVRRHVYIAYDSDYRTNEMICLAINALAEEFMERGAYVYTVDLPEPEDEDHKKQGLDDLLTFDRNGAETLQELLHQATPLTLSKALWKMNNEVIYIRNPGLVVVKESDQKLSPSAFKDHAYSAAQHVERTMDADGNVKLKKVPAAQAWLKWPLRLEAKKLTYAPGQPKLIGAWRDYEYNTWPGWGCEPKAGDVQPFLDLVNHIFTGVPEASKTWFLRWCAYPLQYPGTKMFSSVLIHGVVHGTGKSLVGYTLGRIYGENFTELDSATLHTQYNEWAENKQLVMGDDVTGSNKREDNDRLKKMITQRKLRLNPKYVPSYEVPDCINYYFTANHPDAFFLEDHDRRNFIHEVSVGALDEAFYVDYGLWLDTGGAEAVFYHLLNLDLGDFNPAAPALMTDAKARMIQDVKSDLGSWVARLMLDPEAMLRIGEMSIEQDLFTNRELLELYDPMGKTGTTANGLGRELRRAGVPQVVQGAPVKGPNGTDRYYILRNKDQWLKAEKKDVQAYLAKLAAPKKGKY